MSPWSVETESKEWILAPVCTWYHKSAWNYHRLGLCLWESTLQCNRYCGRRKPLNLLFRWSCSVMSHMFSEFSVWADTRTSGLVNELTQRLGDRRHLWKQNTGDSSLSLSLLSFPFIIFFWITIPSRLVFTLFFFQDFHWLRIFQPWNSSGYLTMSPLYAMQ